MRYNIPLVTENQHKKAMDNETGTGLESALRP